MPNLPVEMGESPVGKINSSQCVHSDYSLKCQTIAAVSPSKQSSMQLSSLLNATLIQPWLPRRNGDLTGAAQPRNHVLFSRAVSWSGKQLRPSFKYFMNTNHFHSSRASYNSYLLLAILRMISSANHPDAVSQAQIYPWFGRWALLSDWCHIIFHH